MNVKNNEQTVSQNSITSSSWCYKEKDIIFFYISSCVENGHLSFLSSQPLNGFSFSSSNCGKRRERTKRRNGIRVCARVFQFRISKQKKRLKWRVMGFCLPEDRMSSIQSQIFNKTIKMGKWGKKIRNNDFLFLFSTHTLQLHQRRVRNVTNTRKAFPSIWVDFDLFSYFSYYFSHFPMISPKYEHTKISPHSGHMPHIGDEDNREIGNMNASKKSNKGAYWTSHLIILYLPFFSFFIPYCIHPNFLFFLLE